MIKRCVSLSLAVLLLAMLTAPALAAGGDQPVTSTGTFWSHFVASNPHNPYWNSVIGFLDPSVCTVSDDGRHHGKVVGKGLEPGAWWAKCDLCSQRFRVYDDDMQKTYEGHVGDMQNQYGTTYVSSDGLFRYYPTGWTYSVDVAGSELVSSLSGHPCFEYFVKSSRCPRVRMRSGLFSLPTGSYSAFLPSPTVSVNVGRGVAAFNFWLFEEGNEQNNSLSNYVFQYFGSTTTDITCPPQRFGIINANFYLLLEVPLLYGNSSGAFARYESFPYIEGKPSNFSGSDIVSTDTRVGTFSGNFGYYGDNGQMILAENISIVNETNNTFHNPVTGDTAPVSSWTYDYGDRSYDITLDTGDTVTVTYGDENVTIVQGGNTYNVYYIVEQGGGEPEPTPTPPPTPTPTPPVPTPTVPPGPEPTEPVDPDAPPDTSGWGILDFLKGIFDFLFGLVKKILDGLSALIQNLLQPSEESINKLQSQVEEKLPFISDLKGFGDDFANALKNPLLSVADNKYTTVVDIGAKKGGVSYGTGQVNLLDVSWYLEYKPMGDAIIEGVCWLSFLWNLYGAVPGIIHGAASGVYSTGEIKRWKDGHEE